MLFATLILDREPMRWEELPRAFTIWLQNAGGLAALGALVYVLSQLFQRRIEKGRLRVNRTALLALAVSWILFSLVILLAVANWLSSGRMQRFMPRELPPSGPADLEPPPIPPMSLADWLLTVGGAVALLTVAMPLLTAVVTRLRFGRIWAMARLSFKEAIRSRAVLIFGAMLPVFLFAAWFIPYKPEDQVRNYVFLLYLCIVVLFFLMASLLGSLGIPADVKSQAIHTIVTKPVEKFEIVAGRFLGYALLITIGLAAVTAVSMIYLKREITIEAQKESMTARVPVYGTLRFYGTKDERSAENVGRQWDIRRYITSPSPNAPNKPREYAIWSFDKLSADVGATDAPVQAQFGLDVFRLTKGIENQGVLCTFIFADGRVSPSEFDRKKDAWKTEFEALRSAAVQKAAGGAKALEAAQAEIERTLVQKHRVYVKAGFNVTDYHTQTIEVPSSLFAELRKVAEEAGHDGDRRFPMFQIAVSVDFDQRGKNQQMLGVARRDLYVLAAENSFYLNFIKGIAGVWCLMMLVLGVAVACSSYLSGIISWLCCLFLIGFGYFVDDVQELAENRSVGGGPLESAYRLLGKLPMVGELEEGPAAAVITGMDDAYRLLLRFVLRLLPNVNNYNLRPYVANGFDISWSQVLFLNNVLPMLAYLFPCALLAFYLMRYREIANPS